MRQVIFITLLFISIQFYGQSSNFSFCGVSAINESALKSICEIAKADSNIISLKYLAKQRLLIAEVNDKPKRNREFDLFEWMQRSNIQLFIYRKAVKQEFLSELLASSEIKSLK